MYERVENLLEYSPRVAVGRDVERAEFAGEDRI
jgi:hypothetical protein